MAMNNRDRVGKAFEYLSEGLVDPVNDVMTKVFHTKDWPNAWSHYDQQNRGGNLYEMSKEDVQVQLRAITEYGRDFNGTLSRPQQAYASELRDTRNRWAHMQAFSSDDTIRALSTIEYLLNAVNAPDSATDVRKLRDDLQRTVYEDHTRKASQRKILSIDPTYGMKPWRFVIKPHPDVASGRFTASEFAADLWQVAVDKSVCEPGNAYGDPVEFFNRTYLTEGLRDLLTRAIRRLTGDNSGSPVVNLQTNFGGGKTHSLLALYHLFGDKPVTELSSDVQNLVAGLGVNAWKPGRVRRVALVGTRLNVAQPDVKADGTKVHTIWGELAWQLGGRDAYDMIAENDKLGKNPGNGIDRLLKKYSPCLILIDEWVAYAKQLVGHDNLPAGTFDDQFVFAQTLTEAVASTPNCMLVVSIPASDTGDSANDIEIGGENGQQALHRLQNIVRRKADQWRPSTRDESFEIVRKRLFEAPTAIAQEQIALTARRFVEMYRQGVKYYPSGVDSNDYEKRIRASYPLHPELLDRLYEDWSGLENFQRTRGVLTLVSSIIHELWASNDSSPLILPGNVPLESESVNSNLTQYLRDPWKPIIDADVSGPDSTAAYIDNDRPALGQRHLTQRIARTVFMGSVPRNGAQNPGISEQYVRLGTAIPGDQQGNFGTALNMLEQRSTYFFNEESHYRYSLQPSIGKTARDFAERLREDPETVYNEIVERIQPEGRKAMRGKFRRVCVTPASHDGIPDVDEATLVITHPRWSTSKGEGEGSDSMHWIRDAIERRGTAQRTNRNMLVFLAADKNSIELAQDAARSYLGWKHVSDNEVQLNLTHQQLQQAQTDMAHFSKTLDERIRAAYNWAIYPEQFDPKAAYRLAIKKISDTGGDSMAQRTGDQMAADDLLIDVYDPSGLGYEILKNIKSAFKDGVLDVKTVWSYITRFPYMPRLVNRDVLDQAIECSLNRPALPDERFALASGRDKISGRFHNLIIPGVTENDRALQITDSTLFVEWDTAIAAHQQYEHEIEESRRKSLVDDATRNLIGNPEGKDNLESKSVNGDSTANDSGSDFNEINELPVGTPATPIQASMKRYYSTIELDPDFMNRDLARINEKIIDQLRMSHAKIKLSLEISAENDDGFDKNIVEVINSNAASLKLDVSSFEEE